MVVFQMSLPHVFNLPNIRNLMISSASSVYNEGLGAAGY